MDADGIVVCSDYDGATGPHTVDTDTHLSESEVDAYVANNGYSTGPHTVDTGTTLSEGEVDAFVADNGYSTGPHTVDTDTSCGLSDCTDMGLTQEAVHASDDDPTNQLLGSSVAYRIAVGPQQGRKVFTLQTLPDIESDNLGINNVGEVAGFSLHAGVATKAIEREKLGRLCRALCAQLSVLR